MGARVGVIGGGSFGTALAKLLADKGQTVTLWVHDPGRCQAMVESQENATYLPGIQLPFNLVPSNDLGEVVRDKDMILGVVPSHAFRDVMTRVAAEVSGVPLIVTATKGIEDSSSKTMLEVLEDVFPAEAHRRMAVLSGPSFAKEIARGIPAAVTVGARNAPTAEAVQEIFSSLLFRVYTTDDVVGVEIGGAVKNVIALGAGVIDGLGLGHSSRAALITRGLAEMARLAAKLGADPQTLSGLSGMGDLVLTCTGDLSRNRTVGLRLGRGETLEEILADMNMVAEGVRNAKSVWHLAQKLEVEMPITEQMYRVVHEGKAPRAAVLDLMNRKSTTEIH